jgi:hypothetical protein
MSETKFKSTDDRQITISSEAYKEEKEIGVFFENEGLDDYYEIYLNKETAQQFCDDLQKKINLIE